MITIAGKTIFISIGLVLASESKLMTYSCFRNKFCPTVSYFEYFRVTSAIKCAFKSPKLTLTDDKNLEKMLAQLNSTNKPSQLTYKIFINKKCTSPEKSQTKCIRDCESEDVENFDWRSIYLLPRKCTLSVKLRNVQFKFLHRRIATNSFLFKINVSDRSLLRLPKSPGNANLPVLGLPGNKCFSE